jgi:pseudouridylate synthase / pseudouridine kinase
LLAKQLAAKKVSITQAKPNGKTVLLKPPELIVIGSAGIDITCQPDPKVERSLDAGSTNPGLVTLTFGGVARNIAESAHRILSIKGKISDATMLISPAASDHFADMIIADMKSIGLRTDGLLKDLPQMRRSAACVMLLDQCGELLNGVADMLITDDLQYKQVSLPFSQSTLS